MFSYKLVSLSVSKQMQYSYVLWTGKDSTVSMSADLKHYNVIQLQE